MCVYAHIHTCVQTYDTYIHTYIHIYIHAYTITELPHWLGAMHFAHTLIDSDPCINWGYWRGSAGLFAHWADADQSFGGVRRQGNKGSDVLGQCMVYDPFGAYIRSVVIVGDGMC
jgi:deoxyribodipyrimidine photolyase